MMSQSMARKMKRPALQRHWHQYLAQFAQQLLVLSCLYCLSNGQVIIHLYNGHMFSQLVIDPHELIHIFWRFIFESSSL